MSAAAGWGSMGASSSAVVWEWEAERANSGAWTAYDEATAAQLEAALSARDGAGAVVADTVPLSAGVFAKCPGRYLVHLDMSMQINLQTNFCRSVRRNGRPVSRAPPPKTATAAAAAAAAATPGCVWSSAGTEAALKKVLFSAACSTEGTEASAADFDRIVKLSKPKFEALFRLHVPGIDAMLDRLGSVPVLQYLWQAYREGLPSLGASQAVRDHSGRALRYSIAGIPDLPDTQQRSLLGQLADAFQACQAEQARAIDQVFGLVSGRDRGLRGQVLGLLDTLKQRVLDLVTVKLEPKAATASAHGDPLSQLPHIQSRYRSEVGEQLGLRGVAAGKLDQHAPGPLSAAKRKQLIRLILDTFDVSEFVHSIIADVNQQGPDAERVIQRDALANWVRAQGAALGFEPHLIYYDEENAAEYSGVPTEIYQPFLSTRVGCMVLESMFLSS